MTQSTVAASDHKLGRIAGGFGVAALLTVFVLASLDHDGAAWLLRAVLASPPR